MIELITVEHINKPSGLMSGLRKVAVDDAASKLDAKLIALGEAVTGARA